MFNGKAEGQKGQQATWMRKGRLADWQRRGSQWQCYHNRAAPLVLMFLPLMTQQCTSGLSAKEPLWDMAKVSGRGHARGIPRAHGSVKSFVAESLLFRSP